MICELVQPARPDVALAAQILGFVFWAMIESIEESANIDVTAVVECGY
jgi:hypothetical protein